MLRFEIYNDKNFNFQKYIIYDEDILNEKQTLIKIYNKYGVVTKKIEKDNILIINFLNNFLNSNYFLNSIKLNLKIEDYKNLDSCCNFSYLKNFKVLVNDLKKKKEIENWVTDHNGNITDDLNN
jgi:hypothetical protein